ncbi:DNA-directed RNA polymerase subunit K [archaeon]|jgi:DNA-directed RNA polymerase subunit K|nr:DNA-directed RNA polymerase subunit K [archaeon]MBT3451386.1 DNA-directed RNA polymerase subunit K [archaeon]MBT6868964.1 DNA-directed RNA polymerase subunit K [archaeon]MBT7193230.1 DNA-directed RNA polymerase subunit K [archaeon]MBT7380085.1 DNA-directed RNA polymerase subunit K [archaeon]
MAKKSDKIIELKKSDLKDYTKYEKARMVGSRALQLSMGAPFLLKISKKELEKVSYNPIQVALKEFEAGVIPITVKRPAPGEKK